MSNQHGEQFQQWLEETYTGDERFAGVHRATGAGVRLEAGEGSYYEVVVRPAERVVRVGFLTTDRAVNEAIEQGILDSGDSLDDLMEVELDDLGEESAAMEHFFERPSFLRRQDVVPSNDCGDAADALKNASAEVARFELRQEIVLDDLSSEAIGQHVLEPVSDFDSHLARDGSHDDQYAVVDALLTDAPLPEETRGVLLDRHALQGIHGRDGNLGGRFLLDGFQQRVQFLTRRRIEQVGEIVDASHWLRECYCQRGETREQEPVEHGSLHRTPDGVRSRRRC